MRAHFFQCTGPVTDLIFRFQGKLGHGFLKFREVENRIISKTLVACWGRGDPAFTDPFGLDPLSGGIIENQDTDKTGGPFFFRNSLEQGQEFFVVFLIRGLRTGKTGGKDPRGPLQPIHHQSRVVSQNR